MIKGTSDLAQGTTTTEYFEKVGKSKGTHEGRALRVSLTSRRTLEGGRIYFSLTRHSLLAGWLLVALSCWKKKKEMYKYIGWLLFVFAKDFVDDSTRVVKVFVCVRPFIICHTFFAIKWLYAHTHTHTLSSSEPFLFFFPCRFFCFGFGYDPITV
jgi:hypothetical protein